MTEEFIVYSTDEKFMIDYLLYKVKLQDWHAVSDAANDLREMQARKEEKARFLTADGGTIDLPKAKQGNA